jgi:C-terminal processing protease CtpA/Prc
MKKWLKILLLSLAALGILAGGLYLLYWNSKVDIAVSNEEQIFPLTSQQKREDFNYLYDTLKSGFPYFEVKQRQYGVDWLSMHDEFEAQVLSTTNDIEYYRVLQKVLNQIQNGHTNIIEPGSDYEEYADLYRDSGPWNQVFNNARVKERYAYWKGIVTESEIKYIPALFRYIEGQYIADDGYAGGKLEQIGLPKGSVLNSVDGVEINEYVQNLKSQRVLAIDRTRSKPMLKSLAIQADKEVQLGITLPDNTKTNLTVSPVGYKPLQENNQKPEHIYTAEVFEEFGTAYLKIPSFSSFYVDKDKEGILDFLQNIAQCKALIIDIRGNGGGSTNYWMDNLTAPLTSKNLESEAFLLFRNSDYLKPFMKRKMFMGIHALKPLQDLPHAAEQPAYFENNDGVFKSITSSVKPSGTTHFSGKIYLLVDKYVFSSAEAFAVFAKSTGWATLIGTDTGGDGIGFDPVVVALPHSGLVVRFPCEMGVTPDGKPNEETATTPDIYVEQTYEDYLIKVEQLNNGEDIEKLENRLLYDTVLRTAIEQISR